MTLSMLNHVSGELSTGTVVFVKQKRTFVDGIAQISEASQTAFVANIQPLNPKELQSLGQGLERIQDYRKIYINSGHLEILDTLDGDAGYIRLNGRKWKIISNDIRPTRHYCKLIVCRKDA